MTAPDNTARMARMRQRLEAALAPTELQITDDSHLHAGHAGARSGKGHFSVRIRSHALSDMRPVQRHQAIYAALGDMMQSDIHALAIDADVPAETA